jgi:hypothetical protein
MPDVLYCGKITTLEKMGVYIERRKKLKMNTTCEELN